MSKRFWIILTLVAVMAPVFGAVIVYAAPDIGIGTGGLTQQIGTGSGYSAATNEFTLSEMVGKIIKAALSLLGTVFFALTVYAGILWMTASGNTEQVEKATNILKTATVGLLIVLAGYGLTVFILYIILSSTAAPIQTNPSAPVGIGTFLKNNWYRLFF